MSKFIDLKTYQYRDILLEPLNQNDAAFIKELFSSPEVIRYTDIPAHKSIDQSIALIQHFQNQYENNTGAMWTVRTKNMTEKAGIIGLLYYNESHHYASFASCLLQKFWNQGIMTRAHLAVMNIAFNETRINRIESQFFAEHTAVEKMLKKSGMQFEGVLKENFLIEGEFCDSKLYAITKSEYLKPKNPAV